MFDKLEDLVARLDELQNELSDQCRTFPESDEGTGKFSTNRREISGV